MERFTDIENFKFSIISVFNNHDKILNLLCSNLSEQTLQDFETIFIDNRQNRFKSAASALNFAADKAKGEYFIFAHQDIKFPDKDWLNRLYKLLESSNLPIGVAGCAGVTSRGSVFGSVVNQSIQNMPGQYVPVQTLDELILIVPREVFKKVQFDGETFTGWHCYGCDYALAVTKYGYISYAINMSIYHESHGASSGDGQLAISQQKLQKKWGSKGTVYTTCGPFKVHENIKFISAMPPRRRFFRKKMG